MVANERQVGGEHYKTEGKPEHWDLVITYGWDYFQGQITKYLMRWRLKNGIEDLEKARHYLDKYIEAAKDGKAGYGGAGVKGSSLSGANLPLSVIHGREEESGT